ncbi:hypothetical protein [Pseudonocardia xishanensis]|uniref:ARB-07466-like C-terminal domain-containing protein n=1 Tax=Pseudonocardia xishanensis TaxID=630995 RepID=A0ABP8RZW4_9PSEU
MPRAGDAVRSIPGPVRHGTAVLLAAGGVVSVLGAAAPLAGPLAAGVQDAAAAFGTSPSAAPGASAPGDTSLDGTALGNTALGNTALGNTALGNTALGNTALGNTALGDTALGATAREATAAGGPSAAVLAGSPEEVTPPAAVSLTYLSDAARTAGERAVAEQRRAEDEARAAEERAKAALSGQTLRAGSGSTSCGMSTSSLGAVKAWVADAAEFLGCQFGRPQVLGVGSRGNASDHPSGLAADFMTSDQATGDSIAACALANMQELGVSYVIWDQQINTGSGWKPMEDRGSPTANHEDHVHVSFRSSAPSGTPARC